MLTYVEDASNSSLDAGSAGVGHGSRRGGLYHNGEGGGGG